MKRFLASILAMIMVLTILAGCSIEKKSDETDGTSKTKATTTAKADKSSDSSKDKSGKSEDKDNGSGGSKTSEPGTELGTFMNNYVDTKTNIWNVMESKIQESEDYSFAMVAMAFAFADLAIIEIAFFDTLTTREGDLFKGTLMFSGIDAWKKVKGNLIEFGYDYVQKEDGGGNLLKGDREVTEGKFDKAGDTLSYEKYTERNGKKISRTIIEITKNSENSYSSQIISFSKDDDENTGRVNGFYTWFKDEEIESFAAEKDKTDVNFSINSIFGQKNKKPADMSKGMTITMKTSYINGKASYEDLSN